MTLNGQTATDSGNLVAHFAVNSPDATRCCRWRTFGYQLQPMLPTSGLAPKNSSTVSNGRGV